MADAKQSERTGDVTPTFEEMATSLDRRRQDLLSVLHAADESRMNTSALRRTADVPSGSMTHHMKKLERWGLVEEAGRAYVGGGSKAIVWQLTEQGLEFCEKHLDEIRTLPSHQEVKHLRERVTELETQLSALETQHEEDIADLEGRMKRAIQSLKQAL